MEDVSVASIGDTCFTIEADDVTIDFNNKNIVGLGGGSGVEIIGDNAYISGAGWTDEFTGGTGGVSGFNVGVSISSDSVGARIDDIRSCGNTRDFLCSGSVSGFGTGNNFGSGSTDVTRCLGEVWPINPNNYWHCDGTPAL
jgi:hypothetical protein